MSSAQIPPSQEAGQSHGDQGSIGATEAQSGRGVVRGVWEFVREIAIIVVFALIISFVVKTWLMQSFFIPSGSMRNTLIEDDRVVVSKLTPGPFDIDRGDIVVFEDPGGWLPPHEAEERSGFAKVLGWVGVLPEDEGNHLIKRVIGLPGDKVSCCTADGKLMVNGEPIDEPYVFPGAPPSSITFDITVPPDSLWVMGDNRDRSSDSRFHDGPDDNGSEGSVPIGNVVGRAFAVIWPLDRLTWLNDADDVFTKVPEASTAQVAPTDTTSSGATISTEQDAAESAPAG